MNDVCFSIPTPSFTKALHCARAFLAALAVLFAWPVAAQDAPQQLPKVSLQAGMHIIQAMVAQTPAQRQIGLMHRREMAANEGMLFVFEQPGIQCFWMKNTLLPLSIAFLSDDGTVVNLAEMQPQSLQSHCSKLPVRMALEMNQSWFKKRHVQVGARLSGTVFTKP